MVTGAEQSVAEFLGPGGQATFRAANPADNGDLRSCEITAGACAQGVSVAMEQGAGLSGGFNAQVLALNEQQGMMRPKDWQPDIAPEQPETPQVNTALDI